jgi:hypothetical protein
MKYFNNLFENEENFEDDYDEYYEVKIKTVVKVEKTYVKCDNSKKNRTKNINRARKLKANRQGR